MPENKMTLGELLESKSFEDVHLTHKDEDIELAGYYGPNILIVSKDGEELYRDNDDSYGWVYDLKIHDDELVMYYDLPDEGSVKKINILQYR